MGFDPCKSPSQKQGGIMGRRKQDGARHIIVRASRDNGSATVLITVIHAPNFTKSFHVFTFRRPLSWPRVWISYEMLESGAFRSLSIHARRALDRIMLEHMQHRRSV